MAKTSMKIKQQRPAKFSTKSTYRSKSVAVHMLI